MDQPQFPEYIRLFEQQQVEARNNLRLALANYVFRRAFIVNASMPLKIVVREPMPPTASFSSDNEGENEVRENFVDYTDRGVSMKPEEFVKKGYSQDFIKQYCDSYYKEFAISCNFNMIRENDAIGKRVVLCSSTRMHTIDPLTWQMTPVSFHERVTPVSGDLICILGGSVIGTGTRAQFVAEKWCVVSEQMLRAWTMIVYPDHPTFADKQHKPVDIYQLRKLSLQGNYLTTNTCRKWVIGHRDQSLPVDPNQFKRRWWTFRTESRNSKWCHILPALVLMVRYGEPPVPENCPRNVPGPTNKNEPVNTTWDLPEDFLEKMWSFWGICPCLGMVLR